MFENYHGEHCARLGAGQSVFPRSRSASNSWLLHSVSFLLFFIPYQCMTTLEEMWVDDTLRTTLWNDFLSDKQKEWNGLILPVCTFPILQGEFSMLTVCSGNCDPVRQRWLPCHSECRLRINHPIAERERRIGSQRPG